MYRTLFIFFLCNILNIVIYNPIAASNHITTNCKNTPVLSNKNAIWQPLLTIPCQEQRAQNIATPFEIALYDIHHFDTASAIK